MIQRVQTVYMLAASVAVLMLMLFPLATFLVPEATYELNAFGLTSLTEGNDTDVMGWSLLVMGIIMIAVPLVCIFLYKNRWLQLRFLIFSAVLDVLYYGLFVYECHNYAGMVAAQSAGGVVETTYGMALVMPAVGVFCDIMAIRGVIHDIALIKSLDRLRS